MSSKQKKSKKDLEPVIETIVQPLNEWGLRNTELYLHQKNNIMKMEYQETTKEREFTIGNRKTRIYTNMGILNDRVGSGKTLTMISLLSRYKMNNSDKAIEENKYPWTIDMGSNHYFSYVVEETLSFKMLNLNIVVCSSSIFQQWEKELVKTDLRYKVITKNANIIDLTTSIIESLDVIVITYNRYRDFSTRFNHLYSSVNVGIKRLIFDELQLKGVIPLCKANFYWIISATLPYEGYDFPYRSLDNNALCRLLHNIKQKYIIVKNTDQELSQSYQQSEIIDVKYICFNRSFSTYGGRVSNEIQRMIAADDIAGAISALGGTKDSGSLLEIIIAKEEKDMVYIKAQISYYSTINDENSKSKIEDYKTKLKDHEKSLENLKERIKRDTEEDNECPLCSDEYKEPVLTYCCKSIMCSNCIKMLYNTTRKCPFCRVILDMKNMVISTNKQVEKNDITKGQKLTKLEAVKNIISSNPKGKFILFSEFSNTFESIKKYLSESGISHNEVKGSSESKQKNIRDFKQGKVQVIFLNSRNDGSGIDLPEATDIILYHKMSSEQIETQVLGRALRLGRTTSLKVHRLLYTEEENMVDNPRNLNHIHTSHIDPQELYRNQLLDEQEIEDRDYAMRLQESFN